MKSFQESQGHVAYMTACSIQRQTEKAVFVQPERRFGEILLSYLMGGHREDRAILFAEVHTEERQWTSFHIRNHDLM